MTALLPELAEALPVDVQLDGELVALAPDGATGFSPAWPADAARRHLDAVTYFVFDVLAVEGLLTTMLPYAERRALLEELELDWRRNPVRIRPRRAQTAT